MKKPMLLLFILSIFALSASELELWSSSAIVIDYNTEQILYQKNRDLNIPPASMTKVVTLYMVYEAISEGRVSKDDLVPISFNADYKNLPRDSSLMFIEQGQNVTLLQLMTGLAIPSGNDAAIAIAEYLYGSVENYLIEVNMMMTNLGLVDLKFVDSSGYSDDNSINVLQFVQFILLFIKNHPEALDELFALESFTYSGITQYNHNPIINIFPNCDGLKTGYIDKSGLNISLTATKDNRRVIAVLTGIKDESKREAELKRVYDSVTLLNYALDNYQNVNLDCIKLPEIKVVNGNVDKITPIIPYKRSFSVNRFNEYRYDFKEIEAPVTYGELLGHIFFTQGGVEYSFPVRSNKEISFPVK